MLTPLYIGLVCNLCSVETVNPEVKPTIPTSTILNRLVEQQPSDLEHYSLSFNLQSLQNISSTEGLTNLQFPSTEITEIKLTQRESYVKNTESLEIEREEVIRDLEAKRDGSFFQSLKDAELPAVDYKKLSADTSVLDWSFVKENVASIENQFLELEQDVSSLSSELIENASLDNNSENLVSPILEPKPELESIAQVSETEIIIQPENLNPEIVNSDRELAAETNSDNSLTTSEYEPVEYKKLSADTSVLDWSFVKESAAPINNQFLELQQDTATLSSELIGSKDIAPSSKNLEPVASEPVASETVEAGKSIQSVEIEPEVTTSAFSYGKIRQGNDLADLENDIDNSQELVSIGSATWKNNLFPLNQDNLIDSYHWQLENTQFSRQSPQLDYVLSIRSNLGNSSGNITLSDVATVKNWNLNSINSTDSGYFDINQRLIIDRNLQTISGKGEPDTFVQALTTVDNSDLNVSYDDDYEDNLLLLGWGYQPEQQTRDSRIPWRMGLGYGVGSQGQEVRANASIGMTPGVELQARYDSISLGSNESSFNLSFAPRLFPQPESRLSSTDATSLDLQGSLNIRPFLDRNGNGKKDRQEEFYNEDLDFLLSLNEQPLEDLSLNKPDIKPEGWQANLLPGKYQLNLNPAAYPAGWQAAKTTYVLDIAANQHTTVAIPLVLSSR